MASLLLGLSLSIRAQDHFEAIDVELKDRAVFMQLPEGVRRVRLQIRNEDGVLETCTIAHLEGTEGYLKLRLPDGVSETDVLVAVSWTDPFPFSFYQGKSDFGLSDSATADPSARTSGPDSFEDSGAADPAVEESDIWKWRGEVLYFFNQYRGLQVLDVRDPAAPRKLASLRVPSSGEQLYLHPSEDVVVLLTYDYQSGNGEVLLVEHTESDELVERSSYAVPGYIVESRMVGSILYVVSRQGWEEIVVDEETGIEHQRWQTGMVVSKLDLTDPLNPVSSDRLSLKSEKYDYWGAQVQATSDALLIATNAWDPSISQSVSTVHVVDISDPEVAPEISNQIKMAGQVLNKFNLQIKANILTVVSQVWRGGTERRRFASVETFDLSEGSEELELIKPLASLEFANNESITASRFVGDLLYVVTFLRVDPLFVIDLSDPAAPRMLGELEVPGFSTHLEVMGEDALISVGIEGSQLAVSWFDVEDSSAPSLVSRVFVGAEDGWSWTEANWDEKAFGFFPESGWILLPYQGSVPNEGWVNGVQLIEIGNKELIKRGSIEHEFQARRARVLGDAVVSISGRSLKTLDISNPDEPIALAELSLSWPVDIVYRVGEYLIQLDRGANYGYYGGQAAEPRLVVSSEDDLDTALSILDLPAGRVSGSVLAGDFLMIAQSNFESNEGVKGEWENIETFTTAVIDISEPLDPEIIGTASSERTNDAFYFGSYWDYGGTFLEDGTLVWHPQEENGYFFYDVGFGDARIGYPHGGVSGRVYAVSVEDPTEPSILSSTNLWEQSDLDASEMTFWREGTVELVGSSIFYGLSSSERIEPDEGPDKWLNQHWLGQLDLAVPEVPVKRQPVEIPGVFEHVWLDDNAGVVLFTSVFRSYLKDESWLAEQSIQASAFDGVQAFLIDEIVSETTYYGPKLFEEAFILLGEVNYSDSDVTTELTTYEWLDSGRFHKHQTEQIPGAVYQLGVVDDVLVMPANGTLSFVDFSDPTAGEKATVVAPSSYYWQAIDLIEVFERSIAYVPLGWAGVDLVDFGGVFGQSNDSLELPSLQEDPQEEWTSISLDLLTLVRAESDWVVAGLAVDEPWAFTDEVAQMDYIDWMRHALSLGSDEAVPEAALDADGDGLSNGMEYLTGSHPGDSEDANAVESWIFETQDGLQYVEMRSQMNIHAMDGGKLTPQYSNNLRDWSASPERFEVVEELFNPAKTYRYRESLEPGQPVFLRFLLKTD